MTEFGKVVNLKGAHDLEFLEYKIPTPGPDGVTTEVVQANICGSEIKLWEGELADVAGGVIGHEGLCRITELGKEVTTDSAGQPVEEGDLVAPVYFQVCEHCSACLRGELHLCQNAYENYNLDPDEWPHFHGTFATHYYIHPGQHFYKIPEGIDPSVAAAANCALSQVFFGIDQVGIEYGDTVVVQGAGGLGLNAIAVANEKGAKTILVEGVEDRIELGREFNVDHVVDLREHMSPSNRAEKIRELTDGIGADVVVEVAGVAEVFSEGINYLRTGGRYLGIGINTPGHPIEFDPARLTRKAISTTSMVRYEPWYLHKSLSFISDNYNVYPYEDILDKTFALDNVEDGLRESGDRSVIRAALKP
jgi:threonine dehydrogenase-like Zn-dependent dehydrogenase